MIGEIELEAGKYILAGLRGVGTKTIGLELEYYDVEKNSYKRLTRDVGYTPLVAFELTDKTQIRAYLVVYNGCDCGVNARPVIYKVK